MIADSLMAAIERITSKRCQIHKRNGSSVSVVTSTVWNDTVASLSLMALGNSAPEILLVLIELFRNRIFSGDLGSSTVVGSAAFKLLVVAAVCVGFIPAGEARRIECLPVFYVTAAFSLFAYLWLAFILLVVTPDVIDVWEALVTLLMFPVLIWVSYRADIGQIDLWSKVKASAASTPYALSPEHGQVAPGSSASSPRHSAHQTSLHTSHQTSVSLKEARSHLVPQPHRSTNKTATIAEHHRGVMRSLTASSRSSRSSKSTMTTPRMSEHSTDNGKSPYTSVRSSRSSSHSRKVNMEHMSMVHSIESDRQSHSDQISVGSRETGSSVPSMDSSAVRAVEKQNQVNSVEFRVDRQCVSSGLPRKPITLIRHGRTSTDVCVSYSVHLFSDPRTGLIPKLLRDQPMITCQNRSSVDRVLPPTQPDSPMLGGPGLDSVTRSSTYQVHTGTFTIQAGEVECEVEVKCPTVGQNACKDFVVRLDQAWSTSTSKAKVGARKAAHNRFHIGHLSSTFVAVEPPGPGCLGFISDRLDVHGRPAKQILTVIVVRKGGCSGAVSCTYHTEPLTAVPGYDYAEAEGRLWFPEGVTEQTIELCIKEKNYHHAPGTFLLVLDGADEWTTFDASSDGGAESGILTVCIGARRRSVASSSQNSGLSLGGPLSALWIRNLDSVVSFNAVHRANTDWLDQIRASVLVNGSLAAQREATCWDWATHLIALPWKLLFAAVPPTSYFGGWLCFWVSLLYTSLVSALLGDLAEILGCLLGIPNVITGLAIVAAGASVPDLLASQSAAASGFSADASIVSVTGGNAANVFFGLGLPWCIGSIYWSSAAPSEEWDRRYADLAPSILGPRDVAKFVVRSEDLGFSALLFAGCSCAALLLLVLRRRFLDAELGGPLHARVATCAAFLALWVGYIGLAAWWVFRRREAAGDESAAVVCAVAAAVCCVVLWPVLAVATSKRQEQRPSVHSVCTTIAEDPEPDLPDLPDLPDVGEGGLVSFETIETATQHDLGNSQEDAIAAVEEEGPPTPEEAPPLPPEELGAPRCPASRAVDLQLRPKGGVAVSM